MRLMDDQDQPDESNCELLLPEETTEPPSPSISTSSQIRVNSILRLTTMFNQQRMGKVVAFDPTTNLVTLHIRGSKSHLTSISMMNLNHCREWTIEEESPDEPVQSLFPLDLNKLRKRQIENEMEKKREVSLINLKASRIGQNLFRDLRRTMNQAVRWSNNDILINNTVRIVEPYRVENVFIDSTNSTNMKTSIKADNDTKNHLMKLVERFWSDPTKVAFPDSSVTNAVEETAEGETTDINTTDSSTNV